MATLGDFNPLDSLVTGLYQLPVKTQFCHHLTTSYSAHKALDGAYDSLNDLKDSIIEKLLGYSGTKFSKVALVPLFGYTEMMNLQVANEIVLFGAKLEEWAGKQGYCDIENLAQEYSGVGAQLKYSLNLK